MRVQPRRTTRRISFESGTPVLPRYTFGPLCIAGTPTDVVHCIKRRRSSAVGVADWQSFSFQLSNSRVHNLSKGPFSISRLPAAIKAGA